MKPFDLPCLVILVNGDKRGALLRIARDRESLRAILGEAHQAKEAKILDLEAVAIEDRNQISTQ
jgi:hypothetical protein